MTNLKRMKKVLGNPALFFVLKLDMLPFENSFVLKSRNY